MSLLIQKYGGTSLASVKHIRRMAQYVVKSRSEGHRVVVVVSAMADETNRLIQLSKELSQLNQGPDYDALLATGEQLSAALFSMALNAAGCPARAFTGPQAGIQTVREGEHSIVSDVDPDALLSSLVRGEVPVVAGFQGLDAKGQLTILGRGGSDATAVALAAALQADECQIYTDVSGVHTVDPGIVSQSYCFPSIHIDEMLAMARAGAQVLQADALVLAKKYSVALRVLPYFRSAPGTKITHGVNLVSRLVGLAYQHSNEPLLENQRDQVVLSVVSSGGTDWSLIRSKVFNCLKKNNILFFEAALSKFAFSVSIEENDVLSAVCHLHTVFDFQSGPVILEVREAK